jgi:chromosome segregation ATPase
MTDTLLADCNLIRAAFQQWRAGQESFDAQLTESLSALAAYQSHLDSWQQQLARERDELRRSREELERDRAVVGEIQAAHQPTLGEGADELSAARERISALSSSLLARTEELRVMDERRSELTRELEKQKQTFDQERAQSAQELKSLRQQLQDGLAAAQVADASGKAPASPSQSARSADDNVPHEINENPVLGSIVEQFGKLRQQRAMDRQVLRKAR